ncbi:N-acetylmuramoyl-L-alanine amidase family protein [Leyella stercorea]|uniref:N-acetylmuramoyl-L-alanine amidase family protein n=1 Tax=Leyella stercorea TaxID=363265 RepID=UPI002431D26F|nr:N-acetylmuramoyl-L-alanine amidase [Leyella stercorea]
MAKKILLIFILIISFVTGIAAANKKFTLVIDPGHGGRDSGAPGAFSVEKNINLNVALAFGRYVEQNCPDVRVVYTRKTDVFIPLYERANIANNCKADLFISVHTNALKGAHTARGFETYTLGDGRSHAKETNLEVAKRENSVIFLEKDYKQHYVGFDPNSPESNIVFELIQDKNLSKSIDFAKMLQKHVCRGANRQNKGVHQQNLAVLRLTSMPACLIELGYISTPDEERFLNNKQSIDIMGRAIYNAFAEYKNKYDRGITVPYKTMSQPLQESSTENTEKPKTTETVETPTQESATPQHLNTSTPQHLNTTTPQRQNAPQQNVAVDDNKPVFKIQILVSRNKFKANNKVFKGITDVDFYEENGMYKYTCGASNNYNNVYQRRKEVIADFPGAFIIAFKNGEKIDVNAGIREFKNNRSTK